jgi:hypothetical protein
MTDLSHTTADRVRAFAMAVVVAALAAVLFLAQDGGPAEGSTYTTNENTEYLEFAGTVRNTGDGWYVLNDTGHEPDDLTMGAVTPTTVTVLIPQCSQVTFVLVGPDETYASTWGASFGGSMGFASVVIKGSINDGSDSGTAQDLWNPLEDYSGSSNIWITGRCLPAA